MAAAKVPITITRKANGVQPPLFVAGTFSSPQWVPQPMDYVTGDDGEPAFSGTFEVEPGSKIQYKFRVGEGDWWVLNDDAPTVTDDAGNKNNIIESPPLVVDDSAEQPSVTIESPSPAQDNKTTGQSKLAGRVGELRDTGEIERAQTPEFARVAAEVADSAALLDRSGVNTPEPEAPVSAHIQEVANIAAEVADTAEALDADEPLPHVEEPPSTYKALADTNAGAKDESPEVAGFSNDPEPVPLFAHECAGLYEDDEIPGADDIGFSSKTNSRLRTHNDDDFDDPTLEKFPSTRDEIISTVRNVTTGLNEDRTTVSGVPPSPLFHATSNDADDRELSPISSNPLNLQVPSSPSQKPAGERSLSAGSLGSIAEGAEGEEERPKIAEVAPVVEQVATEDSAISVAKKTEGEATSTTSKPSLEPLVTIPSPSAQAENGLLSPASNEDEAVVLKGTKGKGEKTGTGYLTPERAATPEPGSPLEPPPNTLPPVAEHAADAEINAEPTAPKSPPRSPRILVSKADDSGQEEEVLPGPSLDPSSRNNGTAASSTGVESNHQGGTLKKRPGGNKSPTGRAETPNSMSGASPDAAKNGNWFSAFFRLIFVDFVGGIVSRLCGGKRKALLTTTVVVVATVGFVSYRKAKLSDLVVDAGIPW